MTVIADRSSPENLVAVARALYEQGRSAREVVRSIYGVDFPAEAFLFKREYVRTGNPLRASWLIHPWELMTSPAEGGARRTPPPADLRMEKAAYQQCPNVVLLGITGYHEAKHGSSLIGYDLDELKHGRSTVVGMDKVRKLPESGFRFTVFGSSLVDVFTDLATHYRELVDSWIDQQRVGATSEDRDKISRDLDGLERIRAELAA